LQSWSNVSALTFGETTENINNVGDLRFGYTWISTTDDAQAWAYGPGGIAQSGDVWFNSKGTSYTKIWSQGSHEFMTAVHEIGHALGLKHNFASSPYNSITLPTYLDSGSFTIMSYSASAGDSTSSFSYKPTTPMILDIDAVQNLYGANTSYNSSNTIYTFYSDQNYHQTIWDSGGVDTIVYVSTTGGTIDLRGGVTGGNSLGNSIYTVNSSGQNVKAVKNIWIATNAVIENATGGSGNDTIIGNAVANTLRGGAGDDTLYGGSGTDQFVFDTTLNASTNLDTIKDFVKGTDKIVLDDDIFSKFLNKSSISAGNLITGTKALQTDDYLIYNTSNDTLYYDADGSGSKFDLVAFAKIELVGTAAPSATDFQIIA
jgi:Ca2+-binding RTX toxin-like protein